MVVGLLGGGADAVYELQPGGELPGPEGGGEGVPVMRQPVSPASTSSAADSFCWPAQAGTVRPGRAGQPSSLGRPVGSVQPLRFQWPDRHGHPAVLVPGRRALGRSEPVENLPAAKVKVCGGGVAEDGFLRALSDLSGDYSCVDASDTSSVCTTIRAFPRHVDYRSWAATCTRIGLQAQSRAEMRLAFPRAGLAGLCWMTPEK